MGFKWIFHNFWMQRTFQRWIALEWLEIDQDNLRMKFSALNVDFSSPSPNPLGSRRLAQAGIKDRCPPQRVVILLLLARVAWKRLQIGTDMLLIITSNCDKLFLGVNIDDLEWHWTLKIGVLVIFFAISGCVTHFKSHLHLNVWRWTWTTCIWQF